MSSSDRHRDNREVSAGAEPLPHRRQRQLLGHLLECGLILLVFFVYGSGATPAVNEAHYLGKAKHFWDPTYCPSDFFFNSADAHTAFFVTLGWPTQFVSLAATAWFGRLVGWSLLSIAWHGLSWSLVPRRGASLLSATAWVALVQQTQMSGEWIIGGVEAKVLAYPLVLWALRQIAREQWHRAWIWLGFASAFHVLVGGWAVVMAWFAWTVTPRTERPPWTRQIPGLIAGGLVACLGLVPALQLSRGVSLESLERAATIYVYQRLPHHLLLSAFRDESILRHTIGLAAFLVLWRQNLAHAAVRRVMAFCAGAVLLTLVGVCLEALWGSTSSGALWLRYYWFRAADIFVPLGISLGAVTFVASLQGRTTKLARGLVAVGIVLLMINLTSTSYNTQVRRIPEGDWQGGIRRSYSLRSWRNVCRWIDQHLPESALFLTPTSHQTFKWYANRAEVVTWKDVPQDAHSLIAWSQRLADVHAWRASTTAAEANARLHRLRKVYGFDYIVSRWPSTVPITDLVPIFRDGGYVVLRFSPSPALPRDSGNSRVLPADLTP